VPAAGSDAIHINSVEIQTPAAGSLAGRLTDLHSAPLAGVPVALRNQVTGAEVHAITAKNGAFRFATLQAGEYTLEADAPQLGHGELEGIVVTGGMEARVQAAMHFEPPAPEVVEAATPGEIAAPQRSQAAMPVTARAAPEASGPPIYANGAEMGGTQIQYSRAESIKTITTVPSAAPATPHVAESARLSNVPSAVQTAAPQTAAVHRETPAALPSPALRASIETLPMPGAPALAATLPRTVPLTRGMTPVLPIGQTVGGGLRAVLRLRRSAPSPAEAAAKSDPGSAAVTTTMTAAEIESLPAGGRRWQEFLLDTPAASTTTDASQQSYRGSQESAEITIDGANTRLAFGASGSRTAAYDPAGAGTDEPGAMSQGTSAMGGRSLGVSEAAIREVTATAGNVEAEGVRSAGGRAGIQTQRGGDALHGQEFYFDRQNTWGARNPFTQWLENSGAAATPSFAAVPYSPADHESVWGLGMGSRILRNNLFWFGAIDGYKRNDPGMAEAKNPIGTYTDSNTGDQYCVGLFCAPTTAQSLLLSAQLDESPNQATNDYLGVSSTGNTAAGLEQLAALLGPAARSASQWVGFGRLDWQAAERHHFTLEGIGAHWNAPGGGLTRVSENYGSNSFGSSRASQEWLMGRWEAYLTPNLLAVTQGSVGRTILTAQAETPSAFEHTFLSDNSYGQLPQIVVDSRYGFTIGNPSRFGQGSYPDEKIYHGQEMLDWVHGRLLVKAGFELDHDSDATSLLRNRTGTYVYSKVQNFISDALAFERFGAAPSGWNAATNQFDEHNCAPGNSGQLAGALPCYSYYSQTMGPTNWHLSTNDWAGYTTAQWQVGKIAVFSAGLRWELEQMPPPIAAVANSELPFTAKLPGLGNNWGPRVSVAVGGGKHWPVLRLGYGIYYGRVENATLETALTQTGSLNGDLYFFLKPTDGYTSISGTSGAPYFPYVFAGEPSSIVKPGVVGFAPNFRNPEVHQAVASVETRLPGGVQLTVGSMLSLGRRLPISIDTNINASMGSTVNAGITYNVCDQVAAGTDSSKCGFTGQGPIKTRQITIPYFYASWPGSESSGACPFYTPASGDVLLGRLCPDYQAMSQIASKANSTYEAGMVRLTRYGRHGLSLHAHYIYAHAMDWNPDGVTLAPESDVVDPNPADFREEYGTSDQDVRHSAAVMAVFEAPWKLHEMAGRLGNGWMLSGIGEFHSGLPYSMKVTGAIPEEYNASGEAITGLGPSINGYGGDNRFPFLPRNAFRYPAAWKADMRLGRRFELGQMRQLEVMAESFNLFNHRNVTEIETTGYFMENGSATTLPSLNFLTGLYVNPKTGIASPAFGQPLNINGTNFYRERQIQFGLRMRF
jgi:hypothetical protein